MTKEELAKWLHDNYEAIAKEQNWDTQQRCKVEFDALPDANKRTMIEIADRLLNFNLLRLHFVVGSALLSDLMKEQQEIISSPIRFNGVHIDKIRQVFEKNGINYNVGF